MKGILIERIQFRMKMTKPHQPSLLPLLDILKTDRTINNCIKNDSIRAVNKADILGRFAMPISRYYMQGINNPFFFLIIAPSQPPSDSRKKKFFLRN
jgi:hypothetical protein